jgi:hypothetical protein
MPLEFRATKLKQRLARYAKRDGNFVLVDSGGFEADHAKQLLEIVYNLLKIVVQSPPINQGQYAGGGSGPQANSSNTVKSVAFNVRSDVTSAARYVAASNVSLVCQKPVTRVTHVLLNPKCAYLSHRRMCNHLLWLAKSSLEARRAPTMPAWIS